jgi:predicted metal-dependent hydrolase
MYKDRQKGTTKNRVFMLPVQLGHFEITLGSQKVPYTLKRSLRAKLIWLDIKRQTGLTVTIPHNYSLSLLPEYLESNSHWILRNLHKYCGEIPSSPLISPAPANTISYLGKNFRVMRKGDSSELELVKLKPNRVVVNLNPSSSQITAPDVMLWLKNQASDLICNKVKQFAQQIGVIYNRVVIRDQKSRWGSCSCRKNLNFNWRLIMAPEPVLDYVIIHELCHLKEMSHSKVFWNLVSRHCPKWHDYRNWLDNHCLELNAQLQF